MPILTKTDLTGEIVWLGRVADRDVTMRSDPVDALEFGFDGVVGEHHSGLTRASCARVKTQYPVGTEIRNTRQVSILSVEELAATAAAMDIPDIHPEWVGATIVVSGIPDFTQIPPSSRLIWEDGASLTVDLENAPCIFPAREIDRHHPGAGPRYKPAAKGRRGVTAWVERPGRVRLGGRFTLHIPPQRIYPHI